MTDTTHENEPGGGTTTGEPDASISDRTIGDRHDVAEERHEPSAHPEHEGWPDRKYIWLAVFLAVVTAAEVYAHAVDWLGPAFVPAMIIMMMVKFLAVVLFFMHLKFDSPIFGWLFWSGAGLAVVVYVGFLLTFHFFNP